MSDTIETFCKTQRCEKIGRKMLDIYAAQARAERKAMQSRDWQPAPPPVEVLPASVAHLRDPYRGITMVVAAQPKEPVMSTSAPSAKPSKLQGIFAWLGSDKPLPPLFSVSMIALAVLVLVTVFLLCGCDKEKDKADGLLGSGMGPPPAVAPVAPPPMSRPVAPANFPTSQPVGAQIAPDGTIIVGPGTTVTVQDTRTTEHAGPVTKSQEAADARGAGTKAQGDKATASAANDPSTVSLGAAGGAAPIGASTGAAGGTKSSFTAIGGSSSQWGLIGAGMLLLCVAGVLFYFTLRQEAYVVGGLGLLFIGLGVVAETAPWVFWIAIAAAFGVAIFFLVRFILKHQAVTAAKGEATAATTAAADATATADAHVTTATVLTKVLNDIRLANPALTTWIDTRLDHHTDAADETTVSDTLHTIKQDNNIKPAVIVPPLPAQAAPPVPPVAP